MTQFTIASFNVKNLIGPEQEYYEFQKYTPEEYNWKQSWLAMQVMRLNADVIGFQEIFEEDALRAVIDEADAEGTSANVDNIPGADKRYRRRAIFEKLEYHPYTGAGLAFAPNISDGAPGQRRPGVAILSRHGFVGKPEAIQQLAEPLDIPFSDLGGGDGGNYRVSRLSRPILKARVPVGDHAITVFNCHLKSKLGELDRPEGAPFAPAADLVNYDPAGRSLGALRAGLRRMAEAWVLRKLVLDELKLGHPVMVLGDFNDSEHAVSTEIITGEVPFRNYAWIRRHDAKHGGDRYSDAEDTMIRAQMEAVRLHSTEKMFVRQSQRDMIYTSAFGGTFESIDQILVSQHFLPDTDGSIGQMTYFNVLNDHLTDGSHGDAPYNKLASDHGQIMARFVIGSADAG